LQNKLDIGDADIEVQRDTDEHGNQFKELIVSFKTIFINIYSILVFDISETHDKSCKESKCMNLLKFKHASF
jgi:hypothetical protein